MLRRLLFTIFVFAFLLGGATIAMEALGLLFADGSDDAEQGIETFIAEIEADPDHVNVPREAGAERLWPPADSREAAGLSREDEERKAGEIAPLAVSLREADKTAAAVVSAEWAPLIVVEARPEADREATPETAPAAGALPIAPVVVAGRVAASPEAAVVPIVAEARQAVPRKSRQAGRAERRRAPRAASRSDCPFLGWL